MSKEYYEEFYAGDLIGLKEGVHKYPFFKTLEAFKKNPRINMFKFGEENLIVLERVYDKKDQLIGYKCLCNKEKVYIMDIPTGDYSMLEVGLCYGKF